jgi:hypothetical protein
VPPYILSPLLRLVDASISASDGDISGKGLGMKQKKENYKVWNNGRQYVYPKKRG